jgi:hypothetical protein
MEDSKNGWMFSALRSMNREKTSSAFGSIRIDNCIMADVDYLSRTRNPVRPFLIDQGPSQSELLYLNVARILQTDFEFALKHVLVDSGAPS